MKRNDIVALAVFALSGFAPFAEIRAKTETTSLPKSLVGCWTRRVEAADERNRWPHVLWYCLKSNGKLVGGEISDGHGGDFGGRWRVQANRLGIEIDDDSQSCGFAMSAERDALTLNDCGSAGTYNLNRSLDADTADQQ